MSSSYLFDKNWKEISRDERRFCADLVFQLETNRTGRKFIDWIIEKNELKITSFSDFEIDFEVCFYRDLIFEYELKKSINLKNKKDIKGLLKRTFDICIFLPHDIIIIEAKAAQGMTSKQMTEFKYDKLAIQACLKELKLPKTAIHIIGLVSAEYSLKTVHGLNNINHYFDGLISWQDIENQKVLKYKQPAKLKTVYSETNKRNEFAEQTLKLIDRLKLLTFDMENERTKHKRNSKDEK